MTASGAQPPEVPNVAGNTQANDTLPSNGVRGGANYRITLGPHTQLFGGARQKGGGFGSMKPPLPPYSPQNGCTPLGVEAEPGATLVPPPPPITVSCGLFGAYRSWEQMNVKLVSAGRGVGAMRVETAVVGNETSILLLRIRQGAH